MTDIYDWDAYQNIPHDSYVAFADASVPPARLFKALRETGIDGRIVDTTHSGVPLIACFTEADDPLPIEIMRSHAGRASSVRVCWTQDVDDLEGTEGAWAEVGRLNLDSGLCLIWDPYHYDVETGSVIDVVKGTYTVEAFYTDSDCLGLRIVAVQGGSS